MQKEISQKIIEFAKSPEIFNICESIGKKYDLHIDQIGEMDSEIRGVLLGNNKSTEFTSHISTKLEIAHDVAEKITAEINEKIFSVMREKIKTETEPVTKDNSTLETAGNFTIVKEPIKKDDNGGVTEADKAKILSNLETPPWKKAPDYREELAAPINEPLVDAMLPETKAVPPVQSTHHTALPPVNLPTDAVAAAPAPTTPTAPASPASPSMPAKAPMAPAPKRSGPDPYKEPIE